MYSNVVYDAKPKIFNLIHVSYHGYTYKNGKRKKSVVGSKTFEYPCEDQDFPYTLTAEDLREIERDIERESGIYDIGIINIFSLPIQLPNNNKKEDK